MALTKIKTGGITDSAVTTAKINNNAVTDAKVADAITVTGAQTGITQVGTLTAGTWQGTAIASAYLDADTAHLSGTQTFSGAKTFSSGVQLNSDVTLKTLAKLYGAEGNGNASNRYIYYNVDYDSGTDATAGYIKFSKEDNAKRRGQIEFGVGDDGAPATALTIDKGKNATFTGSIIGTSANFSGQLECGGSVTGVSADSGANDLIVGNTSGEAGMSIICNTDSTTMIDFREEGESSGVKGRILYDHSANNRMQLWSGGSATITMDENSRDGIGNYTINYPLQILSADGTNCYTQYLVDGIGTSSSDGLLVGYADSGASYFWNLENTAMYFGTNATERLRIYASGELLSTTNSSTSYSTSAELSNAQLYLYNSNGSDGTGDNNYASIRFGVGSGAQSVGWLAYQRNGDNSGAFHLNHRYGGSDYKRTHSFGDGELYVMGNISTNRSELVLHTNDGGTMKAGVWMRGGSVSSGVYQSNLFIRNFRHSDNKPWSDATDYDSAIWTSTSSSSYGNLWFGTRGAQAMKIDTSQHTRLYGMLIMGQMGTNNDGIELIQDNNGGMISLSAAGEDGTNRARFFNENGIVGSITTTNSGTAYNTSSDYRLKENEVSISDAVTRLKQLKPYQFNFKANKDIVVDGFFAHEVSSIVPEAVFGDKDAVDDDGEMIIQGMDNSKLVPLLVSALQEAINRIEALENA